MTIGSATSLIQLEPTAARGKAANQARDRGTEFEVSSTPILRPDGRIFMKIPAPPDWRVEEDYAWVAHARDEQIAWQYLLRRPEFARQWRIFRRIDGSDYIDRSARTQQAAEAWRARLLSRLGIQGLPLELWAPEYIPSWIERPEGDAPTPPYSPHHGTRLRILDALEAGIRPADIGRALFPDDPNPSGRVDDHRSVAEAIRDGGWRRWVPRADRHPQSYTLPDEDDARAVANWKRRMRRSAKRARVVHDS